MSTNPPTVIVTAWQLDEVSVVPVPADARAGIRARAQAAREATVNPTTEPTMTDLEKALSDAATQFTTTILAAVRAAAPKPTAPAETDEQRGVREAAEKAQREKDATAARSQRDDDDEGEGGDGDGTGGDEAIHTILDMMANGATATRLRDTMHIHPTVSELIPTIASELRTVG